MVSVDFKDGETIVREGEPGDLLYMIKKGNVRCTINGKFIKDMEKGDFFGEQALLYGTLRTATVTAVRNVSVLTLHRENVTKVFGTSFEKVLYKNTQRIAFEKSRVLKDLSAKQRELVIGSMKIVNYAENAVVVQKGALKGNKLMIILKGKLAANGNQYSPSQCIGDNELLLRPMGKYEDNLLSVERTDLAEISREEIEKLLQGDLKSVLEKNLILSILKHVQIFRSLPPYKIESLISILRSKEYKKQQYIFFQNEPGLNFFIIKEGEVEIIKEGIVVRTLGEFDYFGERSIILKENRTASARAKDKLVV